MTVEEMERFLFRQWDQLCVRLDSVGLDGLSTRDRVFHAIWLVEAEVDNGGFSQLMFNSTGDHATYAVSALRRIGANELAAVCERFFDLLPGGTPASNQDARQQQLDEAADALGEDQFESACTALEREFYALEDELRRLLVAYLTDESAEAQT